MENHKEKAINREAMIKKIKMNPDYHCTRLRALQRHGKDYLPCGRYCRYCNPIKPKRWTKEYKKNMKSIIYDYTLA